MNCVKCLFWRAFIERVGSVCSTFNCTIILYQNSLWMELCAWHPSQLFQTRKLSFYSLKSEFPWCRKVNKQYLITDCIITDCIIIIIIITECIITDCIITDCIMTDCIITACLFTDCIITDCLITMTDQFLKLPRHKGWGFLLE